MLYRISWNKQISNETKILMQNKTASVVWKLNRNEPKQNTNKNVGVHTNRENRKCRPKKTQMKEGINRILTARGYKSIIGEIGQNERKNNNLKTIVHRKMCTHLKLA